MSDKQTGNSGESRITADRLRSRGVINPNNYTPQQLTVAVGTPGNKAFYRCHPTIETQMGLIELETNGERETYAVIPEIAETEEAGSVFDCHQYVLRLLVNKDGVLRFWRMRIPSGLRTNTFETALQVSELMRTSWVKASYVSSANGYMPITAAADFGQPEWSDEDLDSLLDKAFRGRIIDSLDHDVLRVARGDI